MECTKIASLPNTPYPRRLLCTKNWQVSWLKVIASGAFPYIMYSGVLPKLPFTVAGPHWNCTNFPFQPMRLFIDTCSFDMEFSTHSIIIHEGFSLMASFLSNTQPLDNLLVNRGSNDMTLKSSLIRKSTASLRHFYCLSFSYAIRMISFSPSSCSLDSSDCTLSNACCDSRAVRYSSWFLNYITTFHNYCQELHCSIHNKQNSLRVCHRLFSKTLFNWRDIFSYDVK